QMAFGFSDGHVELWDLRSRTRVWSVTNHARVVTALSNSVKGRQIAVGYEDGRIDLLRLGTGATVRSLQNIPLREGDGPPSLEFSRDGRKLLAAPISSTELPIWNLENGQMKRLPLKHREGLFTASFSDDGEWVVTTSFDAFASLWEVDSGREVGRFTGQFTGFSGAAISPDKTRVALTGNSIFGGELSVWDPVNEQQLVSFPAQGGRARLIGWDPNADTIATVDHSFKLRLWHAPSWAEIEAAQKGGLVARW